ncbi:hypothetical protein [Vreelandella venusta]|uniref:hypothetical protein n=1 Tax=Vreelandella venusta TaxID=44935 RepID=UPI00200DE68E|nr:hypothetical protein [Halomonas venusta]MDX1356116.1 hypothetical protein [Halomonas venusta]UQI41475.1 hypothetical protein M3L73_04245 [Halomonas venusta]
MNKLTTVTAICLFSLMATASHADDMMSGEGIVEDDMSQSMESESMEKSDMAMDDMSDAMDDSMDGDMHDDSMSDDGMEMEKDMEMQDEDM